MVINNNMHSNIVELYDIFESKHHIYLVLELCEGGELFDVLLNSVKGWFDENETINIIKQIADSLQYLHSYDIIHRDLKLENLLISKLNDTHESKHVKFRFVLYLFCLLS